MINIGGGHKIKLVKYKGEVAGLHDYHFTPAGKPCQAFIPFTGRTWANEFNGSLISWEVVQAEPLTLSPSLECRTCGDHGFIRNGCWEKA